MKNETGSAATAHCWPLIELLGSGGDSRLTVDADTLLNKYGCSPFPRPAAYTFASSTATSISDRAYAKAAAVHSDLERAGTGPALRLMVERQTESLRSELISLLGLADAAPGIVFSASGTDSQLHALFIAQSGRVGPTVSILAAADETGSGTENAALGLHFGDRTAQGEAVVKGSAIAGLPPGNQLVQIPLRDENGRLSSLQEIDAKIIAAVERAIASGARVILHVMDCSKLGSRCPKIEAVEYLILRHAASLQVVVDACQGRLSRAQLARYLRAGCMVVITGSKFFTGPPFCGALIVPSQLSQRMAMEKHVPAGMLSYLSRLDVPDSWSGIRDCLRDHVNLGQLLRWSAALEEIRAYFAVPTSVRKASLELFATTVPQMIEDSEVLQLLSRSPCDSGGVDAEEMHVRTIFPFLLKTGGSCLCPAAAAAVYRALNRDVGRLLPRSASDEEREMAKQLCHIGQPVSVRHGSKAIVGAIRISAGARFVYGSWCAARNELLIENRASQFAQVRSIIRKLDMLQKYPELLNV